MDPPLPPPLSRSGIATGRLNFVQVGLTPIIEAACGARTLVVGHLLSDSEFATVPNVELPLA